jgi:hypothetical protein
MKNIIEKWESVGFLKNVKNKNNVVIALEYSCNKLFGERYRGLFESIIIPIIINVIDKQEYNQNKNNIMLKVDNIFNDLYKLLNS